MFWHYTTGLEIDDILSSGILRPSRVDWAPEGRAAIWFSSNEIWEPTVSRAIQSLNTKRRMLGSREWTELACDGLYRISVSPLVRLGTWWDYCEANRLAPRSIEAGRRLAAIQGSHVGRWSATLDEIAADDWLLVERWYQDRWGVIEGFEDLIPVLRQEHYFPAAG